MARAVKRATAVAKPAKEAKASKAPVMRPAKAPAKKVSKFWKMKGCYKGLIEEVGDNIWNL